MKLKLLISFALFCMGAFIIQSCTNENGFDDDSETSEIEIEIEEGDIAAFVAYCRYNVTYSEAAHINVGSIVCTKCVPAGCLRNLNTKVKVGNNKVTVKGTRVGSACKPCPSDGTVI